MRTLTIRRLYEGAGDAGTFGIAYDDHANYTAVTLERSWRDIDGDGHRDRNVSRIPAGEYFAVRRVSPKRGFEVFELLDVPDTDHAQIHPGNLAEQLEGCIAVGRERRNFGVKLGIGDSVDAFNALMTEIPDKRIRVVIHDIER